MCSGAQLWTGLPGPQQGYGLVSGARSWYQLAKMGKADDPKNPELTSISIAQVKSGLKVEVKGFHEEYPGAGCQRTGEIWITRHGGYSGGRPYSFTLRGNDGTYELIDVAAILQADKSTRIRFRSNGSPGWHITFLELRDTLADVVIQDIPLSVRTPEVPQRIASGIDRYETT